MKKNNAHSTFSYIISLYTNPYKTYKRDASAIEFPNAAEGIDDIYEVVDHVIRVRMDPVASGILESAREEMRKESEKIRLKEEKAQKRTELLESMKMRTFWYYCEVCGKKEYMTAEEAFNAGWDYPPGTGYWGLLGSRTCGGCLLKDTLFW